MKSGTHVHVTFDNMPWNSLVKQNQTGILSNREHMNKKVLKVVEIWKVDDVCDKYS